MYQLHTIIYVIIEKKFRFLAELLLRFGLENFDFAEENLSAYTIIVTASECLQAGDTSVRSGTGFHPGRTGEKFRGNRSFYAVH